MIYSLVARGARRDRALAPGAAGRARKRPPEEFSAILSNISNVGGAGLTPLTIRINRWTTDADDERLLGILRDKGQDAFLDALLDSKAVGSISTPTSLKYDFFYARQSVDAGWRPPHHADQRPADDRRRAGLVGAEPGLSLHGHRPSDTDKEGKGEGTLAQMVQLRLLGQYPRDRESCHRADELAEVTPVSVKK